VPPSASVSEQSTSPGGPTIDYIAKKRRGRLVQDGSHAGLMEAEGLYERMFRTQAMRMLSTPAAGWCAPGQVSKATGGAFRG